MIAVVPHDKERFGWNGHRTEVVARRDLARDRVGIPKGAIGVLHRLIINIDLFVSDLDCIPCYGNDPFYKIFLRVLWEFEYHDVSPLGVLDRDEGTI